MYKLIGDIPSSASPPVVILHGGPGLPSQYMSPHQALYDSYDNPVIFYDQIGCGKSTRLPNKPSSFWSVELFMDELDNLLRHFNITDNFSLLGHSWGGMLAADYAATRRPAGLKRLVLADAPVSMEKWRFAMDRLVRRLPSALRSVIESYEEGVSDEKEYQDVIMEFNMRFVCRLNPWPEDVVEAFKSVEEDSTVYHTMIGPSDLHVTGNLKTWSVVDKIHVIDCPTLVTSGDEDEVTDICVAPFFQTIKGAKWARFESSHLVHFEDREKYLETVGHFLTA